MRSKYAQLINISGQNGFATVSRAPGRARRLQRGAKLGRKNAGAARRGRNRKRSERDGFVMPRELSTEVV